MCIAAQKLLTDVAQTMEQMPFTAITCGNHELYIDSTITNLAQVHTCEAGFDALLHTSRFFFRRCA